MQGAQDFVNVRTRLQRIKDFKFLSGWTESLGTSEARIRFKNPNLDIGIGEEFSVESFGVDRVAMFMASVVQIQGSTYVLAIKQAVTYRASSESVRMAVVGIDGKAIHNAQEIPFEVIDMSETGMGARLESTLEKGATIRFELRSALGNLNATGKVMYCRADADASGMNRIGLAVEGLSRIEKAKWNQLMWGDAADAA